MKIRLAKLDDLQQLLYILNTATLDLQQKGIHQWDYPWDRNKIVNQIENNFSYVLILDKKIIGTFYISEIEKKNEFTVEVKSKYLSQIAVLPEFQGENFGSSITQFACSFVKGLKKTLYFD